MAVGHVFGHALETVMKRAGETRKDLGRIAHSDPSLIGKVIKGTRNPSKPVIHAAAKHYDDGELFIAAAAEVTGGASVPWLSGADLHPSSAYIKTMEEIREAEDALRRMPVMKPPERLTELERRQIKEALIEQIEAITALTHHVAVQCRRYDFSYAGLWSEHHNELKSKHYVK